MASISDQISVLEDNIAKLKEFIEKSTDKINLALEHGHNDISSNIEQKKNNFIDSIINLK